MGLDITLHRKNTPYGKDYWFDGRIRFGKIRDLMVDTYKYIAGTDLLLTIEMVKDLLTLTHKLIIVSMQDPQDFYDVDIYIELYNALIRIAEDIYFDEDEEWYFEATW